MSQQTRRKPTAKDWAITLVFLVLIIVGISAALGGSESTGATPIEPSAPAESSAPVTPEPAPEGTISQQNAVRSAESYLAISAFSRQGLIDQLKFEDYSTKDATYAVDHITVNWNEQAAAKAKSYLESSSFSRQGLIDQLRFEGFTQKQAAHGVRATGL